MAVRSPRGSELRESGDRLVVLENVGRGGMDAQLKGRRPAGHGVFLDRASKLTHAFGELVQVLDDPISEIGGGRYPFSAVEGPLADLQQNAASKPLVTLSRQLSDPGEGKLDRLTDWREGSADNLRRPTGWRGQAGGEGSSDRAVA